MSPWGGGASSNGCLSDCRRWISDSTAVHEPLKELTPDRQPRTSDARSGYDPELMPALDQARHGSALREECFLRPETSRRGYARVRSSRLAVSGSGLVPQAPLQHRTQARVIVHNPALKSSAIKDFGGPKEIGSREGGTEPM